MSNSVIFKKEYCLTEVDVFGIIKGYTNHPNLKPHGGYGMQMTGKQIYESVVRLK